ncbi:class I SAM-dependent methyltransferase [archaeon]|nr:MAG: class I SAM-dependent methyltransferase [archaeon]
MEAIISVSDAYNQWSTVYDTNANLTRDLEGLILRRTLSNKLTSGETPFRILEIGCGTGKNTEFYASLVNVSHIVAVDLSENMLEHAKKKIHTDKVSFRQADILQNWNLFLRESEEPFDVISFSLVLEHIDDLDRIFTLCRQYLRPHGLVYVGELHPFKQYMGCKARFYDEKDDTTKVLTCFTHHISEFVSTAQGAGLGLMHLSEHFDDECGEGAGRVGRNVDRGIPRILCLLFEKA